MLERFLTPFLRCGPGGGGSQGGSPKIIKNWKSSLKFMISHCNVRFWSAYRCNTDHEAQNHLWCCSDTFSAETASNTIAHHPGISNLCRRSIAFIYLILQDDERPVCIRKRIGTTQRVILRHRSSVASMIESKHGRCNAKSSILSSIFSFWWFWRPPLRPPTAWPTP